MARNIAIANFALKLASGNMLEIGRLQISRLPFCRFASLPALPDWNAVMGLQFENLEVRERMKRLPLRPGMSKRPVLVYDGQLDPVVEGSGFFAAIVSGRRLLGQ